MRRDAAQSGLKQKVAAARGHGAELNRFPSQVPAEVAAEKRRTCDPESAAAHEEEEEFTTAAAAAAAQVAALGASDSGPAKRRARLLGPDEGTNDEKAKEKRMMTP
jgi:hypothetical protein